ncbi:MAG TPA: amidophosphoribosyltransferase [Chloroflexota bacterium]|nr:amidophosphoribosyltransferase [Chloroflexota bacterium]
MTQPAAEAQITEQPPREACGVFGIYGEGLDAARIAYFGLYALQHRGQESAGIVASDGETLRFYKAMGLVSQVFNEDILRQLEGHMACGHNRYSTTGGSREENAQPVFADGPLGRVFIAHNGNLVNSEALREGLAEQGVIFRTTTDSELIADLIASAPGATWAERVTRTMPKLIGSYSLVMLTKHQLIGARDPLGNRPLCIGKRDHAWVLASESCALDTVGAQFIREVDPGEVVVIDADGITSHRAPVDTRRHALCLFEYIYLARADSVIEKTLVYETRYAMGRQLAKDYPVDADVVIGVPSTALPAAHGYAAEAGLPYRDGLMSNRYIHRTFIQPDQSMRQAAARLKYNPLPEVLKGKRVVVVDDSIVRGTSQEQIVGMLRRAGAREVHLRICAPPLRHPCFLGVDMATYGELIAHRLQDVEAIRDSVGADSLGYLTLEGAYKSVGLDPQGFCTACFSGDYPIPVQLGFERANPKLSLENPSALDVDTPSAIELPPAELSGAGAPTPAR